MLDNDEDEENVDDYLQCNTSSPTGLGFGDSIANLLFLLERQNATEKADKEDYTRIDWNKHVQEQVHRRLWNSQYRMSPEIFTKLVDLHRPQLQGDPMRLGSHQPIIPEVVAAIGIAT
jgi:hypothetical protein